MKKLTALMAAFVMMFALITGSAMASEEDLTGIWYCELMEQDGQVVDGATMASMGMVTTVTLNEDGSAVLSMSGVDTEGTWTDGAIEINGNSVPFEINDGKMTIGDTENTMILGREEPVPVDLTMAPAVEDPELSDLNGTWNVTSYVTMGLSLPLKIVSGIDVSIVFQDGTAVYKETDYDTETHTEVTGTIELEIPAEIDEDGTIFLDFGGEKALESISPGASGIRLTLHEDGRISGEIPELNETLEMLKGYSEAAQNESAEEAEGTEADEEGGSSGGSSSGEEMFTAFFIFEKAE